LFTDPHFKTVAFPNQRPADQAKIVTNFESEKLSQE
jgi:hypothetical protein